MVVTHAQTGRPFATKYAQAIFGAERAVIDTAFPGDIIGLVNANALKIGDTIYVDEPVTFPPIATFAPEHFAVATAKRQRQVQAVPQGHRAARLRGRGPGAPLGPARQTSRRCSPRSARCSSRSRRPGWRASSARPSGWSGSATPRPVAPTLPQRPALASVRGVEVMERSDGTPLVLAPDKWRITVIERDHPELTLEPLIAGDQ